MLAVYVKGSLTQNHSVSFMTAIVTPMATVGLVVGTVGDAVGWLRWHRCSPMYGICNVADPDPEDP